MFDLRLSLALARDGPYPRGERLTAGGVCPEIGLSAIVSRFTVIGFRAEFHCAELRTDGRTSQARKPAGQYIQPRPAAGAERNIACLPFKRS